MGKQWYCHFRKTNLLMVEEDKEMSGEAISVMEV